MKLLIISTALALSALGASAKAAKSAQPADAAASAPAPSTQQNKMKTCNADAKTKALKGDERKAFMKQCLSKK